MHVRDAWLCREGEVVAACEVADDRRARRRGLRGRDDFEGALLIRPCRQVHTAGMRFPIDVAFCDGEGTVISVHTLAPWRISPLRWGAAFAVEAKAGAFERWHLGVGNTVEVVDVEPSPEAGRP